MAAVIRCLCHVEHTLHARDSDPIPALTVYEGEWAYCANGGSGEHEWGDVDPPLPIEEIPLTSRGKFVLL